MIQSTGWRVFGAASFALIYVACAGGDTPDTDADLEARIAERFANGAVAAAGSGGRANTGGRGNTGGSGQASAGTNGVGGSGAPSGGAGSAGECDGFVLLQQKCGGAGCHGANSPYSNFAESEEIALGFVGESGEAQCASAGPLIDPGNPAASIIIQKVTAAQPPCGARMPVVGQLSQSEISCLQEWISTL